MAEIILCRLLIWGGIIEPSPRPSSPFYINTICAITNLLILKFIYNRELAGKTPGTFRSSMYMQLKAHPGIVMMDGVRTYDHSKYYIFDRRVMILGGINIEDKEYYSDLKGRRYHDYMVKISDPDMVAQFLEKRTVPINTKRFDTSRRICYDTLH